MYKIKIVAQENFFWKTGSGRCYFWMDEWTECGILKDLALHQGDNTALIQDFTGDTGWIWNKLSEHLPLSVAIQVFLMPYDHSQQAQPIWKPAFGGVFSIKTAWNLIRHRGTNVNLLESCWGSRAPTTISLFWWKLMKNWLPVDEVLQSRSIVLASKCYCCNHKESISHVMLFNKEIENVWKWFSDAF